MLRQWTADKNRKYDEKPTMPRTTNTYYNEAWTTLATMLRQSSGLPKPNLCLDSVKGQITQAQWLACTRALIEIIRIGERQKWLTIHVDGCGLPTFLLHELPGNRVR